VKKNKEPALYQLHRHIAGFDFFVWLVMQKAGGAESVAFDITNPTHRKFPPDEIMRRYHSILKPGPALLGMEGFEGTEGKQYGAYNQPELCELVRQGLQIPRLKSVLPPGNERYTVTLRQFDRFPNRNSRVEDWRTFAAEIGARVIEDYTVEPMDLHERMALYAGADMNFFVTNGPVMLCFLSEYPAMGFDVQNSPPQGVAFGESYPFLLPQHKQVWEPDTLENIRKHFAEWQKSRWV
jgi:hypothetical protein